MTLKVKFWGVRGSRTVPGDKTLIYGGNTACVEVRCGRHLLVLDAGSGICELMQTLKQRDEPLYADLFISHMHWDHIMGLPFFDPLYQQRNILLIHGADGTNYGFAAALRNLMRDPNFPVSFDDLKSRRTIVTHSTNEHFSLKDCWLSLSGVAYPAPDIRVTTHPNQHPNGGIFYKIAYAGKQLCYVTDTECADNRQGFVESLVRFASGCDLLIMDANYTPDEYEGKTDGSPKKGWGHASWRDCVTVAQQAGVKKLCLFHHRAERADDEQSQIEQEARRFFAATIAAKEGLEVIL